MISLVFVCLTLPSVSQVPLAWINEFHYDNAGTDQDEFIELVVEGLQHDHARYSLLLYNGSNGSTYGSAYDLAQFQAADTLPGKRYFLLQLPVNGLQNGSPDGLALLYIDSLNTIHLLDSLAYEGSLMATAGPAAGSLLPDILVSESNSTTPAGYSLQRFSDHPAASWMPPSPHSAGHPNQGQNLPVTLYSFSAEPMGQQVLIRWITLSEVNSGFFSIEGSSDAVDYTELGRVEARGNSNTQAEYEWTCLLPYESGCYLRLRMTDRDGGNELSDPVFVRTESTTRMYYADSKLHVSVDEACSIMLTDSRGRVLQKKHFASSDGEEGFCIQSLPTGVYIAVLRSHSHHESLRFIHYP
jgi:hypothetical protein